MPLEPRLLLGEKRSRELRADAAMLGGRASANKDLAWELREFGGDPFGSLGTAVGRVERLAETIAARQELNRRELFKAAAEQKPDRGQPRLDMGLRDNPGRPAKQPVERYRRALGRVANVLSRYSEALAPSLRDLRSEQLASLVHRLGEPWKAFSADKWWRHQLLVNSREEGTKKLLGAAFGVGQKLEAAGLAEATRDASRAFDASDGSQAAKVKLLGDELTRIDKEIDEARLRAEVAEGGRFVREHPNVAIYDAAFRVAQERDLSPGRETADVEMGID
jgi:hypothetical protein